jgi:acyl carrier protein phosphodiesterase
MNYLAHAYLSFGHPQLLAGNMISDFVKGRQQYTYPPSIQAGIRLHRSIDAFTDAHPATREAQEVFRKDYRLYSGALVDIIYDHYLATDRSIFTGDALERFSLDVYASLEEQRAHLHPRFLVLFPYMRTQNWLLHYAEKEGIERSLVGLVRRAAYLQDHATAYLLFNRHYDFLGACYRKFFEDVKRHAAEEARQLLEQ